MKSFLLLSIPALLVAGLLLLAPVPVKAGNYGTGCGAHATYSTATYTVAPARYPGYAGYSSGYGGYYASVYRYNPDFYYSVGDAYQQAILADAVAYRLATLARALPAPVTTNYHVYQYQPPVGLPRYPVTPKDPVQEVPPTIYRQNVPAPQMPQPQPRSQDCPTCNQQSAQVPQAAPYAPAQQQQVPQQQVPQQQPMQMQQMQQPAQVSQEYRKRLMSQAWYSDLQQAADDNCMSCHQGGQNRIDLKDLTLLSPSQRATSHVAVLAGWMPFKKAKMDKKTIDLFARLRDFK